MKKKGDTHRREYQPLSWLCEIADINPWEISNDAHDDYIIDSRDVTEDDFDRLDIDGRTSTLYRALTPEEKEGIGTAVQASQEAKAADARAEREDLAEPVTVREGNLEEDGGESVPDPEDLDVEDLRAEIAGQEAHIEELEEEILSQASHIEQLKEREGRDAEGADLKSIAVKLGVPDTEKHIVERIEELKAVIDGLEDELESERASSDTEPRGILGDISIALSEHDRLEVGQDVDEAVVDVLDELEKFESFAYAHQLRGVLAEGEAEGCTPRITLHRIMNAAHAERGHIRQILADTPCLEESHSLPDAVDRLRTARLEDLQDRLETEAEETPSPGKAALHELHDIEQILEQHPLSSLVVQSNRRRETLTQWVAVYLDVAHDRIIELTKILRDPREQFRRAVIGEMREAAWRVMRAATQEEYADAHQWLADALYKLCECDRTDAFTPDDIPF